MKFSPLLAALAIAAPAFAAAPLAGTNAPGFHRIMLGDFEVTAVSDGTVDLPIDKLLHELADVTTKALARNFQTVPTETSVNGFLINTGSKLILVDTGAGADR